MRTRRFGTVLALGVVLWLGGLTQIAEPAARQKQPAEGTTAENPAARLYSKNLGELRKRFNRDKGKVRLLVLLSPT